MAHYSALSGAQSHPDASAAGADSDSVSGGGGDDAIAATLSQLSVAADGSAQALALVLHSVLRSREPAWAGLRGRADDDAAPRADAPAAASPGPTRRRQGLAAAKA